MIAKLIKRVLMLILAVLALTDVLTGARTMLYSGDEIFNLDAILTFFRTGDYTTGHFGGFPFDPVISSGVLATWPSGLGFLLGGNLYAARAFGATLQLLVLIGLGFCGARLWRMDREDAVLFALTAWTALLFVGNHELRIINPGEMWGFAFALAGVLAAGGSLRAAAFCWGLATWLCKIIYLPFTGLLLLVALTTRPRGAGAPAGTVESLRKGASLALWFVAPLLAWMTLIWLRHDARTVVGWAGAYLVFVTKHVADISLEPSALPGFTGWQFAPGWSPASFLSYGSAVTRPALIPLGVGPAVFLVYLAADYLGDKRTGWPEHAYLSAVTLAVTLFGIWFLTADPTQWGRHLLPAIYVSAALGIHCSLRLWSWMPRSPLLSRSLGLVLAAGVTAAAYQRTATMVEEVGWKASYAKACHGPAVTQPPCWQDRAQNAIFRLTQELCGLDQARFDEVCMEQNGAQYLARAADLARANLADPGTVATAGYMMVYVQRWSYSTLDSFLRDLQPLTCRHDDALLRLYLRETGLALAVDPSCS